MKFLALIAVVAARRIHQKEYELIATAEQYEQMGDDDLLVSLNENLRSALTSESRGDGDAAVAKTAAIKNI